MRLARAIGLVEDRARGLPGGEALAETLSVMLRTAYEEWYERDSEDFEVLGAEKEFYSEDLRARGVVDLVLRVRESPRSKFLVPYAGKLVLVDWKTTGNHLDTRWRRRNELSWQWRIYSAAFGASLFLYRGVSTYLTTDLRSEVREFGIVVPGTNYEYVKGVIRSTLAEARALESSGRPWPRALDPSACMAYGQECKYLGDCHAGEDRVTVPLPAEALEYMTYSRLAKFRLCPDKYRMDQSLGAEDETDSTTLGKLFHLGAQALYSSP